jgi:hypothetical protein
MDPEGCADDPTGVAMREIPLSRLWWNATPWISEHGVLRRRFYNPALRSWSWGDVVRPSYLRDRLGYHLDGRFVGLEQAIALAWVQRRAPMPRLVRVELIDPAAGVVAHNLCYADERHCEGDDDDDGEAGASDAEEEDYEERWTELNCQVGIVPYRDSGYRVSNRGRIRRPDGRIEPGVCGLGLSRYCRIGALGYIPIAATAALFEPGRQRFSRPPPRIRNLLVLLKYADDCSVGALAQRLRVRPATVWTYALEAIRHVSSETAARLVRRLRCVPHEGTPLEVALRAIVRRRPELLGARLTPLVGLVTRELAADPDWRCNAFRHAETAAVRALLQREAAKERALAE